MRKHVVVLIGLILGWLLSPAAGFAEGTTIRQGVIDTLKTTPRLEMMKYNREAVKYDYLKARGGYYPKLNARAGIGREVYSDQTTRRLDRDDAWRGRGEASLILTQLIYDGDGTTSQVNIDRSRMRSIDHRVFDNAEALALDATLAALDIYRQGALLEIAERNIQAHENILGEIKDLEEAGAGSIADVTQTRARLSRTLTTRITLKSDHEAALSNFERLAGYRPEKILFPAERPDQLLPQSLEDLLKDVLEDNPKLLTAQSDIETASHRVAFEDSKFAPTVYLEGAVIYEDGVEADESWSHTSYAMARATWNLYNGGSDRAAKRAAMARKLQAEMEHRDLERSLANEARATWSDYRATLEEEKALEETVAFNKETKELYLEQFSVGQRSLLDLLDTENEYFQASGLYITAKVNRVANAYKLLALTGQLINGLDIDPKLYQDPKTGWEP